MCWHLVLGFNDCKNYCILWKTIVYISVQCCSHVFVFFCFVFDFCFLNAAYMFFPSKKRRKNKRTWRGRRETGGSKEWKTRCRLKKIKKRDLRRKWRKAVWFNFQVSTSPFSALNCIIHMDISPIYALWICYLLLSVKYERIAAYQGDKVYTGSMQGWHLII